MERNDGKQRKKRQRRPKAAPVEAPIEENLYANETFFGKLLRLLKDGHQSYVQVPPGTFEDLTREATDYQHMQAQLFQGIQFNTDITPSENLKVMTSIRAGTPERDATFTANTIAFAQNYFVQAQWDGLSTAIARLKYKPHRNLDITATGKVGPDYNKNFIAEFGMEYKGNSYTLEAQYEGVQEEAATLSFTYNITSGLNLGSAILYSFKQKSSMMTMAARAEIYNLAFFGTCLLTPLPLEQMTIAMPNRITAGLSVQTGEKQKISTELQINPSQTAPLDTLAIAFYEANLKTSTFKSAIDNMLRLSVSYEETMPTGFGLVSFSGLVDYLKKEYKFGVGFTVQQ